jgi:diguanylate cyclase (GGDEF)-like protein
MAWAKSARIEGMLEPEHLTIDERLLQAGGGVRLVRFRLRLALLAMFLIPLAIFAPVLYGFTRPAESGSLMGQTILIALLAMVLGSLVAWISRRILEPAEQLAQLGAEVSHAYRRAKADSLIDPLTGLGNHRAFQEELDRQLATAGRYGGSVTLALIDLDGFKRVNDTYGHATGDELLASVGRLMVGSMRRSDRCFRIGGDEYAIVMPNTDAEAAAIPVRRLLAEALGEARSADEAHGCSFSAGLADFPAQSNDRNELLRYADAALYWAKRHGRTAVHVFEGAHLAPAGAERPSAELSSAIQRTAELRLLRAVFQPIVDLGDGRIIGYEGLVRPLTDSGFANPGAMFEAAVAAGRTVELDLACLDTVITAASQLGLDGHLSLNLSPRTFEAPEFSVKAIAGILARHGLDPQRTVIEVTEREGVEDLDRVRRNVEACRAAGLRIAADDVGAGNAGLRLLSQVRFDIVKIDLSIVQGGAMRDTSYEVLRSLRDLATRWQALVVAEGVETPEQLVVVRALGMSAAQGYLLARPSENPPVGALDLESLSAIADWLPQLDADARVARLPEGLSIGA